jgi:hypothetical protein
MYFLLHESHSDDHYNEHTVMMITYINHRLCNVWQPIVKDRATVLNNKTIERYEQLLSISLRSFEITLERVFEFR